MAYTCLPVWPLTLFGIVEPAALVWAYVIVMIDPIKYYSDQTPNYPISVHEFSPQALAMTLQMGNVLWLLAGIALICCWTKHHEVTFWYFVVVAFADYGHIYASYRGIGPDHFWNVADWNGMMWGNVGASLFLNVNRWLTVLGIFGKLGVQRQKEKKRA